MSFIDFIATQKFRFDVASSFMTFVNFALLSITASTTIKIWLSDLGAEIKLFYIIVGLIIFAFISIWLIGYLLDRKAKYWQSFISIQNRRNPEICQIIQELKELKEKNASQTT